MNALFASLLMVTPMFLASMTARGAELERFGELYRLDIKIGDRLFHDLVVFQKEAPVTIDAERRQSLTGSLTVPGVFTVPLTGEVVEKRADGDVFTDVRFEIIAKERGQEFNVRYEGSLTERRTLEGSAYLEDGSRLGMFTAYPLAVEREGK